MIFSQDDAEGFVMMQKIKDAIDRDTALSVLKDLTKDMYVDYDLFGNKVLCISVYTFEEVRKKYLDNKKGEKNNGISKEM